MKSIRTQILVFLMAGAVIVFAALGLFFGAKLNELPEHILEQYVEIANVRAEEVGSELESLVNQVQMVSQSSVVRSMEPEQMRAYLPELVLEGKHRNMSYAYPDGTGWSTLGVELDITEQEQYGHIFAEGRAVSISQPFTSPFASPDIPIIVIAHAVERDGSIVGLVNIVEEIGFLNRIVSDIQLRQTGHGWIVNSDGLVIAHPDASVPTHGSAVELVGGDEQAAAAIIGGESGTVTYTSQSGRRMIALFQTIAASPDWKFVISISSDEVYGEVHSVRDTIIGALILCLLIVVLFAHLYSDSVAAPIHKLKKVFEEAANGNLQVKADEHHNNEVGEAAKSFNRMLDQVKNLTYVDPITGLYNYNGFMLELPHKLKALRRQQGVAAMAVVSIDDFKRVNSISGYEAGNTVLRDLSLRLSLLLHSKECIGRYFGDELIVLLHAESNDEMARRINQLWEQSTSVVRIKEQEYVLKTSIGFSILNDDHLPIEEYIHQATIAKLKVKQMGGNHYQFYSKHIDETIKEEQHIENELFHAVEKNQLYLLYQPITDLSSGSIVGAEALLRWAHPLYGRTSPQTFIKIAEHGGSIIEIGTWVLEEACRQNVHWQRLGYPPIVVSVNVSALQFEQPNFVEIVERALKETGMEPSYLELELTESMAMEAVEEKLVKMRQLKQMGIRISIDDFGTGYSSLAYFTRFPIDTLKIDRSFIDDMARDENAKTLVQTIITMARLIQVKTIAEGVETDDQRVYLSDKGCDHIQGYLISRPVQPGAFEQLLLEQTGDFAQHE